MGADPRADQGRRVVDWGPGEMVVGGRVLSRKRIPDATAELFNATIRAMHRDGTLGAIAARHAGPALAPGVGQF